MNRLICLAAVIVPVLGLGALWAESDHTFRQGTEWEVPIQGYDPRDYLRGHYVEFAYDWPGIEGDVAVIGPDALCLSGQAPRLERAAAVEAGTNCPHPLRADSSGVYGWSALTRGRLYVGQDRAAALQRQLQNRDQRGIVTIRQRDDGSFAAVGIHFRPLTPAEIAERDAPDAQRAEELPPPPAITSR